MKSLLAVFTLSALSVILLDACSNNPANAGTHLQKNSALNTLQKDFNLHNLSEFSSDTFSWEIPPGSHKEIDGATFYMIWQDGKRSFTVNGDSKDYLFSWQNRDTGFIEFTILTRDGSDYCHNLTYCIFDKAGIAIDNFVLSSLCGDGGWTFNAYGKFTTPNTYEKICIELEMAGIDSIDNKEWYEGDSTVYHFTIEKNGHVAQKEISRSHIRGKW